LEIGRIVRRSLNTAYVIPACAWERQMPWAPPWLLRALQQIRFRLMIRHAWKHVPFYREAMRALGLSPADFRRPADLHKLPLINNETLREDPARFHSERFDPATDTLMKVGNYKRIYWSKKAALQWFARLSRNRAVLNRLLGVNSGYIEVHIQPQNNANYVLNRFWSENLLFRGRAGGRRVFDTNDPYPATLEALNEIRPDIVYSFGSHTERFFRYIQNHGMKLDPPRIWVYGSDMMSPGTRELIEENYGCIVYSAYSMNEMGAFAFACEERKGFHLNTDACHVRIADENGNSLPDGVEGEIVISNLVNKATVLLNYRTGDRGMISPRPCPCGRTLPLLEDLQGRISDTLHCADGRDISFMLVLVSCGPYLARVSSFQVVQERRGNICWHLVPFPDTDREGVAAGLRIETEKTAPPPNEIEVRWVERIEMTPSQKRKFVVHRFVPEE